MWRGYCCPSLLVGQDAAERLKARTFAEPSTSLLGRSNCNFIMGNGAGKKVAPAPADGISPLIRRRFSHELAMVDAVVVATRWKQAAVVGRSAHHNSDKPSSSKTAPQSLSHHAYLAV